MRYERQLPHFAELPQTEETPAAAGSFKTEFKEEGRRGWYIRQVWLRAGPSRANVYEYIDVEIQERWCR